MSKLERIDEVIQRTTDLRLLKILNRKWWKEWFSSPQYAEFMKESRTYNVREG